MERLFLAVLNQAYAASWVILGILLLRVLLRRAPRRMVCALWAFAALRLICPFSISSALSLLPNAAPIPADIAMQAEPAVQTGIQAVDSSMNPLMYAAFAPSVGDSVNPLQIILSIAAIVWLAGVAVFFIAGGVSARKLKRRVRASISEDGKVWRCDEIASPFIFGLWKPRIYVPGRLPEGCFDAVVAHELAHLRHGDPWWKLLGYILRSIFWFHPLCWVGYWLFCRDLELACDEAVICTMKPAQRADYSQALLNCGVNHFAITPLAFGETSIRQRVKAVLSYRRPTVWILLAAVLGGAALAVFLMTSKPQEIIALQTPTSVEVIPPADMQSAVDTKTFELRIFSEEGELSCPIPEEETAVLERIFNIEGMEETPATSESPCVYEFSRENTHFILSDSLAFVDAVIMGETYSYYGKHLSEEEISDLRALIARYIPAPDVAELCRSYLAENFSAQTRDTVTNWDAPLIHALDVPPDAQCYASIEPDPGSGDYCTVTFETTEDPLLGPIAFLVRGETIIGAYYRE